MAFCDRLKEARKARGLTQGQLGEFMGVAKSTIAGYESGRTSPDVNKIYAILDVLGVDANFLWQDELRGTDADPRRHRLLRYFDSVNDDGKDMMVAQVEVLAGMSKYQQGRADEGTSTG